MDCTRCGKFTMFPPLCAACEKEDREAQSRRERPAMPMEEEPPRPIPASRTRSRSVSPRRESEPPRDMFELAAKKLGISVETLKEKLRDGSATMSSVEHSHVINLGGEFAPGRFVSHALRSPRKAIVVILVVAVILIFAVRILRALYSLA